MATRYPKQLASNPTTNTLLKLIAENDATNNGNNNPNESWTFRRLVLEEAKRRGIRPPRKTQRPAVDESTTKR